MSPKKYLKQENRKWLIGYLLLQVIIFAIFSSLLSSNIEDISDFYDIVKNPKSIFSLGLLIVSIVLEGLLNNPIKEFLVFWRIKDRLPGHRAFSNISENDSRINLNNLQKLFPNGIPKNPRDQNSSWYDLYKKFQNEPIIYNAHKMYLLTRDLTALSVSIIPFVIAGHLILRTPINNILYNIIILIISVIVISISARNYGNRFVANVIVEASTQFNSGGK